MTSDYFFPVVAALFVAAATILFSFYIAMRQRKLNSEARGYALSRASITIGVVLAVVTTIVAGATIVIVRDDAATPNVTSQLTVVVTVTSLQSTTISELATPTHSATTKPPALTPVALNKLCSLSGTTVSSGCSNGLDNHVVDIGANLFSYDLSQSTASYPKFSDMIVVSSARCTSMALKFGLSDTGDSGAKLYIRVIQTSGAPQQSNVTFGSLGALTVKLDGGAFAIQVSSTQAGQVSVRGRYGYMLDVIWFDL